MSSESSGLSKSHGVKKTKSRIKTGSNQTSEESDGRHGSRGSRESRKSINSLPPSKVTVLEHLSEKSAVVNLCRSDEPIKGTASTRNTTAPTVITAVLKDLQDDIVRSPNYRLSEPVSLVNGDRAIAVIGGDNIYVQNKTKFVAIPRNKALSPHRNHSIWAYQTSRLEEHSPLDVAIMVQKIFVPISSVCFGLLGGVALLQLVLVNSLVSGGTDLDRRFFLQSYSKFAELTPILFYILLAVCTISVLDRIAIDQERIMRQQSWVVVGVYLLTLILTLSCASYDDMIVLYPQNKTLFEDRMKTQELLSDWQLLNSLRCLFAILGWILFSITSPPDLLLHHLLQNKQFEHQKQPTSVHSTFH